MSMISISDPRIWPGATAAKPYAATLHEHAAKSLAAATAAEADVHDDAIVAALRALIANRDGRMLTDVLESSPSAAFYRHVWRALARAEETIDQSALPVTVFAIPLVIVAGAEEGAVLDCVLPDADAVAALLKAHGALRGNQTLALANALASAETIDIAGFSRICAAGGMERFASQDIAPAPIAIESGDARVHLRFIIGAALAARGVDLVAESGVGNWGLPLVRLLGRLLDKPGATVLTLPRAPKRLCVALQHGRAAQREVAAQLFASNAIRTIRASVGEPAAAISAHHAFDAPAGGELRLSLSSVFDPRAAEGFRCPLYRADQADDVAGMLTALLHDCRISDVRIVPGVHPDRDSATGLRLPCSAAA